MKVRAEVYVYCPVAQERVCLTLCRLCKRHVAVELGSLHEDGRVDVYVACQAKVTILESC